MSSLTRKKVEVDDDPLMKLWNREEERTSSIDVDPTYSVTSIEQPPLPIVSTIKATKSVAQAKKSTALFDDKVPEVVQVKPSTSSVSKQSVQTPPKPATLEDLLTPSTISSEYDTEDNIFKSVPTVVKAEKSPKNSSSIKAAVVKIDFNKEDDEIGDLQVAFLLEKEDKLDYALFGKVESTQEKKVVQQKKPMMEIEAETDFLRQLDELTAKASTSSFPSSAKTPEVRGLDSTVATKRSAAAAVPKEFDLNSLDLNAYIEQESSSGGGLFDD